MIDHTFVCRSGKMPSANDGEKENKELSKAFIFSFFSGGGGELKER